MTVDVINGGPDWRILKSSCILCLKHLWIQSYQSSSLLYRLVRFSLAKAAVITIWNLYADSRRRYHLISGGKEEHHLGGITCSHQLKLAISTTASLSLMQVSCYIVNLPVIIYVTYLKPVI